MEGKISKEQYTVALDYADSSNISIILKRGSKKYKINVMFFALDMICDIQNHNINSEEFKFNLIYDKDSKFIIGLRAYFNKKLGIFTDFMFSKYGFNCSGSINPLSFGYASRKMRSMLMDKDVLLDIKVWMFNIHNFYNLNSNLSTYNVMIASIANKIINYTNDVKDIVDMYNYTLTVKTSRHPTLVSAGLSKKYYSRTCIYHALVLCYKILTMPHPSCILKVKPFVNMMSFIDTVPYLRRRENMSYNDILDIVERRMSDN